jgi:hypothetical protein
METIPTLRHTHTHEGKSKIKGTFKKHVYCKYKKTKATSLFNVTLSTSTHRFQRFTGFFNSIWKKKFFGYVFSQFCTAPMTSSSDENLLPLRASFHWAKHMEAFVVSSTVIRLFSRTILSTA